jgi:MFS superfamily sulfate permease-like transporter
VWRSDYYSVMYCTRSIRLEYNPMADSSQFRMSTGGGLLSRLVAMIVGIGVLGVAIFLGAIFLAVVVGFILIAVVVVLLRVWWLKRKMQRYERDHGDLSAEYVEVREANVPKSSRTLPEDTGK